MKAGCGKGWRAVLSTLVGMGCWLASAPLLAATEDVDTMILAEADSKGVPGALALAVANAASSLEAGKTMPMPLSVAEDLYQVTPQLLANSPRLNIQVAVDYLNRQLKGHDGNWEAALGHYYDGSEETSAGEKGFVNNVLRLQKSYARQGLGAARKVETEVADNLLQGWTEQDLSELEVERPTGAARRGGKGKAQAARNTDEDAGYSSRDDESATRDDERHAYRDDGRDAYRDDGRDAYRDDSRDAYRDDGRDAYRDDGRDAYRDDGRDAYRDDGRDAYRDSDSAWNDDTRDSWQEQDQAASRKDEVWGVMRFSEDNTWYSPPPRRHEPPVVRPTREIASREQHMVRECLQRTHKPVEACRRDVLRVMRGLPPA